jgi:hypothetical protein
VLKRLTNPAHKEITGCFSVSEANLISQLMHLSPAATSVMKLSETLGVVLWNRIATLATEVRSNPAEKTVLGAAVRAFKGQY